MPALECVVDTWVLEIAQDPHDRRALDALVLLRELKKTHKIAVDHKQRILREYWRHAPANSHAGEWLRLMISRADKLMWRSGDVSTRHHEALNGLRFDPSDMVFVGVASEGPDRLLISEDSDYSIQIKAYLQAEMGVEVLTVDDSLTRVRDP